MSVGAGDRSDLGALRGRDDRDVASLEPEIGGDLVALLDKELVLTVDPDLTVRVRVYAADRRAVLIDVATTAQRALNIAALFQRAAVRAGAVPVQLAAPADEVAS